MCKQIDSHLLILVTLWAALVLGGCQGVPFSNSTAEPAETQAGSRTGEGTESEQSSEPDHNAESGSFTSSLREDEILSQTQVIKVLRENGYEGGAGYMDVNGERMMCEFAGKRPSDGATICIRKNEEEASLITLRPRLGTVGPRRL